MKSVSELRQDVVSGAWVVIATGRAKRPHEFLKERRVPFNQPKRTCPFEKLHNNALVVYASDGEHKDNNWWVQVIPNKYPAFGRGTCAVFRKVGLYRLTNGVGFHEVVVTRDHTRSLAQMSDEEAEIIFRAYQDRYLAVKDDECVEYISILHNHGRASGATISHPHSQIMAIPVIPPDFWRSIKGTEKYFKEHKDCIYCLILRYEGRVKDRIIYENDHFMVIAPYASKIAFEMRVVPKRHSSHFELTGVKEREALANAVRTALAKLYTGLHNPDYNFFIHTAPTAEMEKFHYYHWHLEILPKTSIWAGFEISTGIEISAIRPEDAAKFLRKIKV